MERTEIIEILEALVEAAQSDGPYGYYKIEEAADALAEPEGKRRDFYRCKCDVPNYEAGFDYCFKCNSHVPEAKMDAIIAQQEKEEEPVLKNIKGLGAYLNNIVDNFEGPGMPLK